MTEESSGPVNLSKLNISMLYALDALLTERSVSRAARKLGLSQPSMSNSLSRLRLAFHDPLLLRSGQEMVLTDLALDISDRVSVIVQEIFLLEQKRNFDPATAATTFRIGLTDHSAAVLMPRILSLVRAEAPNVRIMTMSIGGNFDTDDSVSETAPHMRMHWIRSAPQDWHITKLLSETMVVIGRKGHPKLTQPFGLDDFLATDQVAPSPSQAGFQTAADTELARAGYRRNVVLTLAHFASLPPVIRETDLIALFPWRLLGALDLLDAFEVVDSPYPFENFVTSIAWHPRYHYDEAHIWMRRLINRAAKEIESG